jgi:hypothetical protein
MQAYKSSPTELIQKEVKHYFHRSTNLFILFGTRKNCHRYWLCVFIMKAIILTSVIVSYELDTKCYPNQHPSLKANSEHKHHYLSNTWGRREQNGAVPSAIYRLQERSILFYDILSEDSLRVCVMATSTFDTAHYLCYIWQVQCFGSWL